MKRDRRVLSVFTAGLLCFVSVGPVFADSSSDHHIVVDLSDASGTSNGPRSGTDVVAVVVSHPEHHYTFANACQVGGAATCHHIDSCGTAAQPGLLFDVFVDGHPAGWQACLTKADAKAVHAVTPARVEREFRRLAWPSASLLVEPTGGRTLVGLRTNFHTADTDPSTRAVTILGIGVQIVATPTAYTWHFASAACPDETTRSAGTAYPELSVTCSYEQPGAVRPSVDTTYSGRFRVGDGPWIDIPDTLTVAGRPVDLDVRQVKVRLTR